MNEVLAQSEVLSDTMVDCGPCSEHAFFAAARTHGCSVLLSEELVVGAPSRGFTKYGLSSVGDLNGSCGRKFNSFDRVVGFGESACPSSGTRGRALAGDRQAQLSLGWRRHSIRPEKTRYYSQEGLTQESSEQVAAAERRVADGAQCVPGPFQHGSCTIAY